MKLTLDSRGLAVWPDDVELVQNGIDGTWFDKACQVRGGETIGELLELAGIEWVEMNRDQPLVLTLSTGEEVNNETD